MFSRLTSRGAAAGWPGRSGAARCCRTTSVNAVSATSTAVPAATVPATMAGTLIRFIRYLWSGANHGEYHMAHGGPEPE